MGHLILIFMSNTKITDFTQFVGSLKCKFVELTYTYLYKVLIDK